MQGPFHASDLPLVALKVKPQRWKRWLILPRPFTEADWASRTLGRSGEQGCESLPWLLLWHQRGDLTHCEAGRALDDSPGGARSQPQPCLNVHEAVLAGQRRGPDSLRSRTLCTMHTCSVCVHVRGKRARNTHVNSGCSEEGRSSGIGNQGGQL